MKSDHLKSNLISTVSIQILPPVYNILNLVSSSPIAELAKELMKEKPGNIISFVNC